MSKLGRFSPQKKKVCINDLSGPAHSGGCEGGATQVYRKPRTAPIQYTVIDEFNRLRFLAAYPDHSTSYSFADFLKRVFKWYRRGSRVERIQMNDVFEFTNRFSIASEICLLCLRPTAAKPSIRHKLIRSYATPQRKGGVVVSYREGQKRLYSSHCFSSFQDPRSKILLCDV